MLRVRITSRANNRAGVSVGESEGYGWVRGRCRGNHHAVETDHVVMIEPPVNIGFCDLTREGKARRVKPSRARAFASKPSFVDQRACVEAKLC